MSSSLREPSPVQLIRSEVEEKSVSREEIEVYSRRTRLTPLASALLWSLDFFSVRLALKLICLSQVEMVSNVPLQIHLRIDPIRSRKLNTENRTLGQL